MQDSLTQDKSTTFIKGAFSLTLSTLIVKLIGFIYKLPLSYILTDEGMGYFNGAYTIFSFFFLLCQGGVPRAISIIITDIEDDERITVLHKLLRIFFFIGLTLFIILFIFAYALSNIIGSKNCYPSLLAIAPSLLFVAISGVLRGYLNGIMSFGAIALSQLAEGVIKLAFGLIFAFLGVRAGYGYPMISAMSILGVTLGSAVGALILYLGARPQIKAKRNERPVRSYDIVPRVIKISAPITASSAILGASSLVDLMLIIRRLGDIGYSEEAAAAAFGNYSTLIIPMINLVIALITPISAAALPMLGERNKSGKVALTEAVSGLFWVFLFFLVPISVAFAVYPQEILALLFDDNSATIAAKSMLLSSPSVLFLGLLTLTNTANEATSDTRGPLIATLIGVIVKSLLTYFLIPFQGIGVLAASIGNSISYAISFIISLVLLIKKGVKIKITADSLAFLLFSFASIYPTRIIYDRVTAGSFSVLYFIIFAIISIVIYLILSALYFRLLSKKDKKLSILTKILRKN